ncbi:MAG: AAA family ATPase [Owenweeksia sp.]|nr:AAA family ATPase [Owenweeksia sp.]
MPSLSTEKLQLAAQFVNATASHIFLTGKAGTGKTTFLHQLGELTHKNFLVVAPTGIAALNARGVTIHSQFLLPLGAYLPQSVAFQQAPQAQFNTRKELARRHPLNSARKQVLRNIDLLIIDEVSMLRADVLDALDYRLKSVKGNFKRSFGGVQLLMIGDLFQLPPIVKDAEWSYLKDFHNSPHFLNHWR